MTLLVAAIGREKIDGIEEPIVCVSSDRMISVRTPNIEYEGPHPKTYNLADNCLMLTAGNALFGLPLHKAVLREIDERETKSVLEIVTTIKNEYQTERKNKLSDLVCQRFGLSLNEFYAAQQQLAQQILSALAQEILEFDLNLEVLVAGVDHDGAHIYRITNPGVELCFDSIGFHAVGSGEEHALANLIAREHNTDENSVDCLLHVVEAKKIGEKASGVGEKTDLFVINSKGITRLEEDKVKTLVRLTELRQKGLLTDFEQGVKQFRVE
jgi:20S proteasome alpha/beta subunit